MFKNVASGLFNIYQNILDIEINEKDFLKGNLINTFHIDSLIALQLIVQIEKRFGLIIEEDELAIKIIDSPSYFFQYYQRDKIKNIYKKVLKLQISDSDIIKENLVQSLNINQQCITIIITEIEKCFEINVSNKDTQADIVNCPFTFLNSCQEAGEIS